MDTSEHGKQASGFGRTGWSLLLVRTLERISALLLFCMMLLTAVDVVGRYLFASPVPGGFEITEIMLATLIFCGLPLATLRDGHITVDLAEGFLPTWFKNVRDRLIFAMMALVLAFLSYKLFNKAGDFLEFNDQTAVLNIPLSPVVFAMAGLTGVSALIAMVLLVTGKPVTESRSIAGQ